MKIFTTYPQERGKCQINPGLLWEYRMDRFDWHKYRRVVAGACPASDFTFPDYPDRHEIEDPFFKQWILEHS